MKIPGAIMRPNRRIIEEYDTTKRSFTSQWVTGKTWGIHHYKGGSKLLIHLHVPCRSDSNSWGGLYTELQVKIDGGNWQSLGHSGYDGVMGKGSQISTYTNSFLWDPGVASDFSCQFRFRHRSYESTTYVNSRHALSGDRWATHLRIEELFGNE